MDWISDLVIKRLSQRTNVFLAETFDMKRIEQMKQMLRNGKFDELCKVKFDNKIEFNIQTNKLVNLVNNTVLQVDPMRSPSVEIDNMLRTTSSAVIIYYVFNQTHADSLADILAAWSQDSELYRNKSTVIVFTSDTTLFNESLRRLTYTITIIASSEEERKQLLEELAQEISKGLEKKYGKKIKLKITEDILQASAGLDLHSTETAAMESFFKNRRFDVSTFTDLKVKILKTYGLEYVQPEIDFSHVGGYHSLKEYIRKRVITPLRNPEKAKYYGVGSPRGIILYGPPGTGKTYFTEALAKELGLTMVKLTPADLFRGIVGESESRVRQITQLVESLSPVVVMVDEIDQIALARGQVMITDSGVSRRITNMLLEWLGSRNRRSFLCGSTNFVENMDFAFIRAGRVDEVCLILPPDYEARKEILKIHCTKIRKVPIKNVDFDEIAKKTFMWTGAELEKLVLDAARVAMDENAKHVTDKHFEEAFSGIEVNINERKRRIQQMVATMKKLENVNRKFLNEAIKEFATAEKDESRVKGLLEAL